MNEGSNDEGWNAMPASGNNAEAAQATPAPMMMQMQDQDNGTDDVFADAAFPSQSSEITI